jgi:hypothetical protein
MRDPANRSLRRRSKRIRQKTTYQTLEPRNLLAAAPIISEFLASNDDSLVDDNGNSTDWIEIYNAGDASINLAGFTLTDDPNEIDKWTFPSVNLAIGSHLVVFAGDDAAPGSGSDLYTGFSLRASGEYVGLYDASGTVVSEFGVGGTDYPSQFTDVSYGVRFDTGNFDQPSYFATPTPGTANTNPVDGMVDRVIYSHEAGFHTATFDVTLTSTTPGATIYYTTDGSTPSATNGFVYTSPVTISQTTTLRTVATKANYLNVPDRTQSYIFIDDVVNQSLDGSAPAGWPTSWGANDVDYGIDPQVISQEGLQTIKDALVSIPTWSLTTDLDNLFDPNTGIYSNAQERGIAWERPASIEQINPDGSEGFQVNAGLRIKGAYSRRPENPKHSFKIYMRGEYGDSELNYPVHGDEGVDTFDKLDLRTAQNWSWSFNGSQSTQFVEDELARINMRDMGQPYTRSVWFHLYINGQYWGIYQTQERHDNDFAQSYFGGDEDDYDVIKARPGITEVADGNYDAYERLFNQAAALDADGSTPNFVNHDDYMRAQGLNPDGTRNLNYEVLLDVDNVIDYTMLQIYGGNRDGPIGMYSNPANSGLNNFFAIRDRTGDQGWQFFAHDSEHTLRDVNEDRMGPFNHSNFNDANYFNPHTLHQKLMANEAYRMQFADRVQQNFFNGGTLSAEAQIQKMYELAAEIDSAVYAESARWGDAKSTNPRLRQTWLNRLADLRDNYFHQRQAVVIQQFRDAIIENRDTNGNYTITEDAPLFPWLDAPQYFVEGVEQSGGLIDVGDELQLSAPDGVIYYTLDGSDPRLFGGGINPNALIYDGSTTNTTAIAPGSSWNFHDLGTDQGTAWREPGFNDQSWSSGNAELGYGDGDESTIVSFGGDANNKHTTTYFRKTFNVAAGEYASGTLNLRRDDGAVVYLNGVEIARSNLPQGTINYDTFANPYASDDGNTWHEFSFDPDLLVEGTNTLAVEIHQVSATSSDISFDAEVLLSSVSGDPIVLNSQTTVNARALASDGTWSAVHVATYFPESASQTDVRITEINYNPYQPTAAEIAAGYDDSDDFEFLEVANVHPTGTVNLSGMQLADGINFTFGELFLAPGERAIVVEDAAAFAERYGNSITPVGEWAGGLSNSGETVDLLDNGDGEVMSVTWGDGGLWTVAADGEGASLVLDSDSTSNSRLGKHYSWRASVEYGGTPGSASASPAGVVINEVLAHTDAPNLDSIELFNTTTDDIDISGWYLSDSGSSPFKYQIPTSTILAAGQFIVFDESDFNPNPTNPGPNDFALSSLGDEIYLTRNDSGVPVFEEVVDFKATFNGQSIGRTPDGSGRFLPLSELTLGSTNVPPVVGPLFISEVNYHPEDPSAAALAIDPTIGAKDLEFIELKNPTADTFDLVDWRLRGELDYAFTSGTISAGETIVVVTFDPDDALNANLVSAFRTHYGIDSTVRLFGAETGDNLNNSFGRISLQQADDPPANDPTVTPWVLVDELVYDDLSPWPTSADGTGPSLHRLASGVEGTLASNWTSASPGPGDYFGDSTAPTLLDLAINDGQSQRTAVNSIVLVFSGSVDIDSDTFSVVQLSDGDGAATGISVTSNFTCTKDGDTTVTLTFSDSTRNASGMLDDGNYQLTVDGSKVRTLGTGLTLGANVVYGDTADEPFFALYGDNNGDRTVNVFDLLAFRQTYRASAGDSNFNANLDFGDDGVVNVFDLLNFRQNYRKTLPFV